MTLLTQKFSKPVLAGAIRLVTLVLFLAALGSFTYVANAGGAAPDDQVSFTATGTAVLTALTKLPGGLTQLDFSVSGKATHLGDFTGQGTRIQNHQGNFVTTSVFVGANGNDSVFLAIGGQFESSKDKCVFTSTGTYTVTGGTGAFANATGSGTIDTLTDLCAGTSTGIYTGTISRPNSN
ncbi:MAG TPA: hypothetical protein VE980_25790 [Pyrinomonadaceae bacterium]|nr:hypothetical protein [Pyrinomonadaceae bacterium]